MVLGKKVIEHSDGVLEANPVKESKNKGVPRKKSSRRATGSIPISPKKWLEIIQYYLSGHTMREVVDRYRISERALYYQLEKRNIKKQVKDERELTENDIAILDREPELKDRIRAELNGAKSRFETAFRANEDKFQAVEAIADESVRLKIYDEVLPILKEKNPILAKNLSALSAKVMVRANALLDTDLSPKDLNDIASALAKVNDILQIIPKTQPLIAQQFNIGSQKQETSIKDIDLKIEFI